MKWVHHLSIYFFGGGEGVAGPKYVHEFRPGAVVHGRQQPLPRLHCQNC